MIPKAIIFGSMDTIIETSELKLRAFNAAFVEAGLDWQWGSAQYRPLRQYGSGKQQITAYAKQMGENVDAVALHKRKTVIFDALLLSENIAPRTGVLELANYARQNDIALGFAADTMQGNIDALFDALSGKLSADDFDFIANRHAVKRSKPYPDIYELALSKLDLSANQVVAIENCEICLRAARAAGIIAIAFPSQLHSYDNFSAAIAVTRSLVPSTIDQALKQAVNGEMLRIAAE